MVAFASDHSAALTKSPAGGAAVEWRYNPATGVWQCGNYKDQWALVLNPYCGNASQWFYFDKEGNMLTGWQWITDYDGVTRCYYLNPVHDVQYGALYFDGRTPDGYLVNSDGAWVDGGKVVVK